MVIVKICYLYRMTLTLEVIALVHGFTFKVMERLHIDFRTDWPKNVNIDTNITFLAFF